MDYSEYGGAPLLGVKGASMISHGRLERQRDQKCDSRGREFAAGNINEQIEAELAHTQHGRLHRGGEGGLK